MKDRPRLLRMDGADADFIWFSTDSWTRPGVGLEHTIAICKRTGVISCTCEDAVCRKKRGDLLDPTLPRCKHAVAVVRWCKQTILKELGGN